MQGYYEIEYLLHETLTHQFVIDLLSLQFEELQPESVLVYVCTVLFFDKRFRSEVGAWYA